MRRHAAGRRIARAAVPGLVLAVAACRGAQTQREQPPVPVTVARTVQKAAPVRFRAIGRVEPIANVAVRARIGGELLKARFEEGQSVRAGDVLFVIDARPYQAALRQAEAQLLRDRALLRKAEEDVRRYADLVEKDFVTKEQYDLVVATADSLAATVAADEAAVENARLQVEYCTITAPVAGRTGNLVVKPGNLVKANDDTPLVTVNQTRPIRVAFSVPAQLLPAIRERLRGEIDVSAAAPEGSFGPSLGKLTFVDNAVDPATNTILLKANFPNEDERLWPGEFVDVTVTLGEEPGRIVAPAPAIQTGQQGQYVFVVKDDGTVEMRPVRVARIDEAEAVIEEGLAAGETVVTDGQLRLAPGSRVSVAAAPGPGAKRS